MPWLTELLRKKITDPAGRQLGRVQDVCADRGRFPKVTGISVRPNAVGREYFEDAAPLVPLECFEFGGHHVVARSSGSIPPDAHGSTQTLLRADVLDSQIVDTEGARVVRVNDVLLSESAGGLRVVGAEVGIRGILRQLGWEGPVVRIADSLGYEIKDKLIAWNYVAPLEESGKEVRLTVPTRILRELHPSELADILDQLDAERRERFLRVMTVARLAETLAETDPEVSREALEVLGEERARKVLEFMPPDEAADLLGAVGYEKAERLLALMGVKEASILRELLGYPPESAGGRMTPSFVSIHDEATVAEAIAEVRAQAAGKAETIYYVYVLDSTNRLRGILSLRQLLRSHATRRVAEIMETDVVTANISDDQEEMARNMSRYNLIALPVIDDERVLKGIVTVDDIVDIFDEEASEDLSQIAGTYLGEGSAATMGRLTGFGLSIAAGLVAALLLRQQHLVLLSVVAGAWLLPIYLRTAQDLGTWSLARALGLASLSPRVQLEALTQELLAAFASSAFLGVLVGVLGAVWSQNVAAASFLGVGIFVGSLASSLIGLALPSMAKALGLKRAMAHGRPLAVIVGLCSLLVYVWALASLAARL